MTAVEDGSRRRRSKQQSPSLYRTRPCFQITLMFLSPDCQKKQLASVLWAVVAFLNGDFFRSAARSRDNCAMAKPREIGVGCKGRRPAPHRRPLQHADGQRPVTRCRPAPGMARLRLVGLWSGCGRAGARAGRPCQPAGSVLHPGLYDNADFDDVVLLITSNLGAIQPSIVVSSRPVAAAVGLVAPTDIASRRLFPPSSVLGRAPPLA